MTYRKLEIQCEDVKVGDIFTVKSGTSSMMVSQTKHYQVVDVLIGFRVSLRVAIVNGNLRTLSSRREKHKVITGHQITIYRKAI